MLTPLGFTIYTAQMGLRLAIPKIQNEIPADPCSSAGPSALLAEIKFASKTRVVEVSDCGISVVRNRCDIFGSFLT